MQVLVALERLELSYRPLPAQTPGPLVVVGFGGCADVTVDAVTFFNEFSDASIDDTSPDAVDALVELNTIDDVIKEFRHMFRHGAAAE